MDSKIQFWSTLFLFEMDKIADSNYFKVNQKCKFGQKSTLFQFKNLDHVSSCNFGPRSNSSNRKFWSVSRRNRVDPNLIFESNLTRDNELLQTLFLTKILTPAVFFFRIFMTFVILELKCTSELENAR